MKRALVVLAVLCAGCGQSRVDSVDAEVRVFAAEVARGISREGPSAWEKYFAQGPAFFMASNGELQFRDRAAASAGIKELPKVIQRITLEWSDVRVDTLSPDLAMMAATFHESIVNASGESVNETGYFTGIAERRDGRWQFRNAHWSVPVSGAVR